MNSNEAGEEADIIHGDAASEERKNHVFDFEGGPNCYLLMIDQHETLKQVLF